MLNRRRFLKQAGAGLATLVIPGQRAGAQGGQPDRPTGVTDQESGQEYPVFRSVCRTGQLHDAITGIA